ncbi:hypothetical protein BGZ95_000276 [Linnemannia exigua]|uniref:DBF4-type domain-containing protein n=1 Tax=Linnemannia exigua TaxID=604196 RepID=A0AAD4D911_9FUNG|nr:hypothetical protein BGZ95_000276 [Linnemannia exigua]
MADRPLYSAHQRAPLQESRGYNTNQPRQHLNGLTTFNAPSGTLNKPGQDVIFARSSSLVNMPLKPVLASQTDKDDTRPRIALQQKPFNGNNANNLKAPPATTLMPSNSMYKTKPVPFPGFTQTTSSYTRSDVNIESRSRLLSQHVDLAQHLPQPQDTEPHTQPRHKTRPKPEYGTPEWAQQMAGVLPRCRFYFDSVDPAMIKKISDVVRSHRGTTTSFFSNEVTHVITTRSVPDDNTLKRAKNQDDIDHLSSSQLQDPRKPNTKIFPNAETSILVKALSLGIKIWTLDSTLKLLNPLAPGLVKQTGDRNLKDMLQYEKVHGVSTIHVDNSTKPDFYAFQGKYVLVDDTTGYYRTIMAYDFTAKPSATGKHPWPRIYLQESDRSPFCYNEPASKESERPPGIRDDKGDNTKVDKDLANAAQDAQPADDQKLSPSAMASGIVNSITSNIISTTTSTTAKSVVAIPQQDRRVEQLEKRALNATKVETGVSVDFNKKLEFARPLDMARRDTDAATLGNARQDTTPNRGTLEDAGNKMQPPTLTPKLNTGLVISTNNERVVTQGHEAADSARDGATNAQPTHVIPEVPVDRAVMHKEVKDYRKQRYCENCRGFFENFEKHIESPAHRKYAHDASKFAQLDILLAKLQRKPKITSALTEMPLIALAPSEPEANGGCSTNETCDDEPVTLAPEPLDMHHTQEAMDTNPRTQELPAAMNESMVHSEQNPFQCQAVPVQETQQPAGRMLDRRDDEEDEGIVEDIDEEVTHDQIEDQATLTLEPAREAVEEGDITDVLSSELSLLGLSERGVDRYSDQPDDVETETPLTIRKEDGKVAETPSELMGAIKAHAPSSLQKVLRHEFRLPPSDRSGPSDGNITSQLETDTTQPDDRFLDGSASASVDDGLSTPIRLLCDLSSTVGSPNASRAAGREYFSPESTHESDREGGSDDAVVMVKVSSSYSPTNDLTSGLYKGALKRKLENVLAEERAADQAQARIGNAIETPDTPRPDSLFASRQLPVDVGSSNASHTSSQRPVAWFIDSPSHSSAQSSPLSPNVPLETLFQTTSPPPAFNPFHAPVDCSLQRQAQLASGYFHPSLSSQLGHESSPLSHRVARRQSLTINSQQTPSSLSRVQQRPLQIGTPIVPFQDYSQMKEPETSAKSAIPAPVVTARKGPEALPSQSSPLAYSSPGGSHSPMDAINFMGHSGYGFMSPTQSPSRRAQVQRTQFPVMTHAEQEQERFFHHYNGNHLPEPAGGAKKMRSSSSLAEAYEEYGEGAMVFIE